MTVKKYDEERGVEMAVVFADSNGKKPPFELPIVDELPPLEELERAAYVHGFDTFEIVRTATTIERYQVGSSEFMAE